MTLQGTPPVASPPTRGKHYLGDGVYLTFLDYGFTLTTENGVDVTNTIVLEPEVFAVLLDYVKRAQQ